MPAPQIDERDLAFTILSEYEKERLYLSTAKNRILDRCPACTAAQRSFVTRLTEGVVEKRRLLDHLIDRSSRSPEKMKRQVRLFLQTGLFQILFMDNIPDHAACHETVRLVKEHGYDYAAGFVNALLRRILREKGSGILAEETAALPAAVRCSVPDWIASLWRRELGTEETEALLEEMSVIPPVTVRFSPGLSPEKKEDLVRTLSEVCDHAEPGRYVPDTLRLYGGKDVRLLPGYREGLWTIQDEAAMLPVLAMGLRGGERVLDVCAAPGGKTIQAAQSGAFVTACDKNPLRVRKIRENVKRLHLKNVEVRTQDAAVFDPSLALTADVLLCDVPCSGLGVLQKKQDIRERVRKADLESLVTIQKQIVAGTVRYLKPGGLLVYSTCTIHRAENEEMARWIRKKLKLIPEDLRSGPGLPEKIFEDALNRDGEAGPDIGLQMLPHRHKTDGFYLACFRKLESSE